MSSYRTYLKIIAILFVFLSDVYSQDSLGMKPVSSKLYKFIANVRDTNNQTLGTMWFDSVSNKLWFKADSKFYNLLWDTTGKPGLASKNYVDSLQSEISIGTHDHGTGTLNNLAMWTTTSNIIPVSLMTSNYTPVPNYVWSSDGSNQAYYCFDRDTLWNSNYYVGASSSDSCFVGVTFQTPVRIQQYILVVACGNLSSYTYTGPDRFKLQASSDSSTWIDLETEQSQEWSSTTRQVTKSVTNTSTYKYYRLKMYNDDEPIIYISEIYFYTGASVSSFTDFPLGTAGYTIKMYGGLPTWRPDSTGSGSSGWTSNKMEKITGSASGSYLTKVYATGNDSVVTAGNWKDVSSSVIISSSDTLATKQYARSLSGSSAGEANELQNTGTTGLTLGLAKSGLYLPIKRLIAGTNITLDSTTGNDIRINSTASGSGWTSDKVSVGTTHTTDYLTRWYNDSTIKNSTWSELGGYLTNGSDTLATRAWHRANDQTGSSGSGITTLNGLSTSTQSFSIGTSYTYPTWVSSSSTHTLNIPYASTSGTLAGLISNTDYSKIHTHSGTLGYLPIWGNSSVLSTSYIYDSSNYTYVITDHNLKLSSRTRSYRIEDMPVLYLNNTKDGGSVLGGYASAERSISIGVGAVSTNTDAISIGYYASGYATIGSISIGTYAGYTTYNTNDISIGYYAGSNPAYGVGNTIGSVMIGYEAGYTTFSNAYYCQNNVFIGRYTGYLLAGNENTLLGYNVRSDDNGTITNCTGIGAEVYFANGLTNAIAIGYRASESEDNSCTIGNSSITKVKIPVGASIYNGNSKGYSGTLHWKDYNNNEVTIQIKGGIIISVSGGY